MRRPVKLSVAIEFVAAAGGFPGFGWLMSGAGGIGLPLAVLGPVFAWGVIPMLVSPFGGLLRGAWHAAIAYLISSAILSSVCLGLRLQNERTSRSALRNSSSSARGDSTSSPSTGRGVRRPGMQAAISKEPLL